MSPTPWTFEMEHHLGDPAYSLFDAAGDRLAVGLLRADAEAICNAVNVAAASTGEA